MWIEYASLISSVIFSGILIMSFLQFSTLRKNMRLQTEQQIYARMIEARLHLENTEAFTDMAFESPVFAKRFSTVKKPEQYYIIVALLDIFEFLFRLQKTNTVDQNLWYRWINLAKMLRTIPKFEQVWQQTKESHTVEFTRFFESIK